MISNNTSYKLKASKSTRKVNDYENNHSDDNYENDSPDGDIETAPKYQGYSRGDGRYRGGGARPRSSEFRSTKTNDRRGAFRGARGGSNRVRGERDTTEFQVWYQDGFYKPPDSSGSYVKLYENEKKNDVKLNLPEDTRISKLLRRLSNETDQDNSLAISEKLLVVLLLPANSTYVRKAFHILGESMYEILQVSPGLLAKLQAARALGRMGYIMAEGNDFERYQTWLFSKMTTSNEEMQILLIKSFKETLELEKSRQFPSPFLENRAEALISNLVSCIETTENAEVFKVLLDVLMSVAEIYPNSFYQQFQDTIDLLFGWHVDHTQPLANIEFISRSLQRISGYFKHNLEFSVSLIENFLEDIGNVLYDPNTFDHETVLILALNSVLKCLGESFHPSNNKFVNNDFIVTCLKLVIKTVTDALESSIPNNLVIVSNESVGLLLGHLETKSQTLNQLIFNLMDLELGLIKDLADSTIISLLLLIAKVIKELSANLPADLIEKLIGPQSEIVKLRYSPFGNIRNSVICVYQALLNLKNVSLLQEAYRYVLGDLEVVYKTLVPNLDEFIPNNPFVNQELDLSEDLRELAVLFLLRCLSQLANASSIIVMWALKPSILELVGVYLEPHNEELVRNHPALQYSLLYLLYSHCKCYNHFISSSNLVTKKQGRFALPEGLNLDDVPNTSPNLGNFEIILDILHNTLSIKTTCEVTLLMLQWLNDILVSSDSYLENLYDNEKFVLVTKVLVKCGYHFNAKIALAVCDNLLKLLDNKQLSWSNQFLISVCDLCKLHSNSNRCQVRKRYSALSANIPWDVSVVEFNKSNSAYDVDKKTANIREYNNYTVWMAQHLHLNNSVNGDIYPLQFKVFMDYLLKNETDDSNWLEDIFITSWPLRANYKTMDFFYDLATNSRTVLYHWSTLESAQFCVNCKLRTPLGKPNETFTKIEAALKHLGNDLINAKKGRDPDFGRNDVTRIRLLLQFIEHLEKSIYNASEGCAVAMQQLPKQVRSFFVANANTCNEWLGRIRLVMVHVAMHAGDPSTALRHALSLLGDLVQTGKGDSFEFERAVMFATLALLSLKEPEAITGIYVWCKHTVSRKFLWVKCASDQAAKRYELAIEGYEKLLSSHREDSGKLLESDVVHFIEDQIATCLKELGNWIDLVNWRTNNALSSSSLVENGQKYWFSTTDWDCVEALFNVEIGMNALEELGEWKSKSETWSKYEDLTVSESNLYRFALDLTTERTANTNNVHVDINENLFRIQKSIRDNLNESPSEFLQHLLVMQYVSYGIEKIYKNESAQSVFLVSEDFEKEIHKIDSSVLRKVLWWSEYFANIQNSGSTTFCTNLRLDLIKRGRREKNFKLALVHVNKFLKDKELLVEEGGIENVAGFFLNKIKDVSVWSTDTARAITEIIKLSYGAEHNHQNTFNLCAAASTAISRHAELYGGPELKKLSSKILLKLANWLQTNEEACVTEIDSPLGKLLMVLPEIGPLEYSASNVISLNEMAVGKLLQFAVHQCASLAKSWNCFGAWCYRWGRKIVDQSALDVDNVLAEDDCIAIKALIPPDVGKDDLRKVFEILSQTRSNIEEEDIESSDVSTSEIIKNQLRCVKILRLAPESDVEGLVEIWRNTQKRIYTYYARSAEAYFKYLQLSMTETEDLSENTEGNVITVTLRLLRLIVKYALELQNTLEEGLRTTPTQPWKVIIPQLFSRLNHPENYVRLRVSDLLCRIAEDAPHLITFPAVVGALEGGLKFDFSEISLPKDCLSQNNEVNDELNEDEYNYDSDHEEDTNVLQSCFKTMVDTLSKQDPETIAQVQSLVKELRRITLLWDELWLGTLAQHQTEITKRQQQLEYEIEKVNDNPNLDKDEKSSLIVEKHRIIIKPIVFVLEQLLDVTSVEAETPHEKLFQEKYLTEIREVINKLKNPDNPEKPSESLQPLKTLQKHFQQKFHKRASYTLKMQAISPTLASVKNTMIAMPGLATSAKKAVTISHVSNVVSILPTKTKPKKLIFYGSDGQTYTYLFKGLEDLHLDERIMQFLSIANTMMVHNADSTGSNLYRARHYSVIPLGPRSGLISWVDGTTPAFALYKRWQQREIAKPTCKNSTNNSTAVLRPSDLFYNKLNPLLKEHGVKNPENRKEWPLSVLKQVLTELMAETPSDLLAKELWCNSISASSWWQVVKRYSYSVAVMSIIGYIIGLGDRHLDNVLVDLTSGEIVHIDYNVCFEKGKTLRVPEKVPFRLTPNISGALGVTGVEGIFRTACENVLRTMRKGRETLLTLLEAFVYDPLIDWTVGGEVLAGTTFGSTTGTGSRQGKKDLEKEVTLSMYNVRCTEMKVEWNENKETVLTEIPPIVENLKLWLDIHNRITETEDSLQDLHQQMALVKEAEAHGANKHSLYTLPSRYEQYCKTQEAMKVARRDLDKITTEAENHIRRYGEALALLDGPEIGRWSLDLKPEASSDCNIFDLVKEFLHNAGKNDVITQCEQSEIDVEKLSSLHAASTLRCLQLLQDYHAILAQCPRSYMDDHRMHLFLKWTKFMTDTKCVDACDAVYANFQSFFDISGAKNTLQFSYGLETLYKETIGQVNKLYDELAKVRALESSASLEKMYTNARLGVSNFLSCEKGATSAFESVIVNELLMLNENFLQLETTASRSGELLIKLTSRDGDWFLDDLVLSSTRAVEMINNLPLKQNGEDEQFLKVLNGVRIANNIYKGLHELHFNFHTIILPESMKKIQNEEVTVLQMIGDLGDLVLELGTSIPDMVGQLEKILHRVLMQMEINVSSKPILERVAMFRSKFLSLIETQSATLSQGKMLLMGFNGLFEKLNQEINNLVQTLGDLDIPHSWKKLDQVKEAKSISAHILDRKVHAILDDIFLLKRVQSMSEFFGLALEMCQSFKQSGRQVVVYGDEQLVKPVRQFIADFISRQLLGITTESIAYTVCFLLEHLDVDVTNEIEQKDIGAESKVPLDELCHKAWNHLIKRAIFTPNVLAQASSFSNNLKTAWEKIQGPKKLELKCAMLQSSAVRMQTQLTVYNFMYEEILNEFNVYSAIRSKFIVDVKTEIQELQTVHSKLAESRLVQKNLVESAHQRLNWAKGANPNVVEISAAFESAVTCRDERLDFQLDVAVKVLSACDSILLHEILRTHCLEAKNYDKLFVSSLEKWRIACQYSSSKSDVMSATEESIMNLLTQELLNNSKWLQEISEIISNSIRISSSKLEDEKANLFAVYDALTLGLEKLKGAYGTHCRLMTDVKSLVKSMVKIEEFSVQTQQFVMDYKHFIDNFGSLFAKFKKDTHVDDIKTALEVLEFVAMNTENVYEGLLSLEGRDDNKRRPQLLRQDCVAASPVMMKPPPISKQESMTKGQQRNAYAVGVWRRVKMKLEGRDPDSGRKYTPQEQVDFVIREATNLDNLALLYEGWTPWV